MTTPRQPLAGVGASQQRPQGEQSLCTLSRTVGAREPVTCYLLPEHRSKVSDAQAWSVGFALRTSHVMKTTRNRYNCTAVTPFVVFACIRLLQVSPRVYSLRFALLQFPNLQSKHFQLQMTAIMLIVLCASNEPTSLSHS